MSHEAATYDNNFVKPKSGGLLLLRRITPLPRRDAVYFCSGAYSEGLFTPITRRHNDAVEGSVAVSTARLTMLAVVVFVVSLRPTHASSKENLTHAQVVASVACVRKNARDSAENGPLLWPDGTYHVRYSTFRDSNEGFAGWHLAYILVYNPDGVSGWIYKLYVNVTKPMVEVGEWGTVKADRDGRMEIDDVWGGLATHELITRRLHIMESAPLLRITAKQSESSSFKCYDAKHPLPE